MSHINKRQSIQYFLSPNVFQIACNSQFIISINQYNNKSNKKLYCHSPDQIFTTFIQRYLRNCTFYNKIQNYHKFNTSQTQIFQYINFEVQNCVMIKSVLLNRLSDALPFCQTNQISAYNNQAIQTIKSKVKKYHKEITAASKSMDAHIKQIQNPSYGIFYKVQDYVIFTMIVENGYPTKLIGSFLDVISAAFFDEAKCILGTQNLRSRLQSIQGSHYFVKFDRIIKQKKKQYDDPSSLKNTERLKKELENIQDIMKENMNFLDKRHNDLVQTEAKAKKLSQQSKNFSSSTKKLVWQLWLKKNMVWIAVICIILFLYFLF